MHTTRRNLILGGLAVGAALATPGLSATGVYHWKDPGLDRYKDYHAPERPLTEGHIRWEEEMNDQLLEALERQWFEEVTLTSETPPEERTWDGMYFGDDRVISVSTDNRRVYAAVEEWPESAPRTMRRYLAQTDKMAAYYDVPVVCGNPSWRMRRGPQPACIPRPRKAKVYDLGRFS